MNIFEKIVYFFGQTIENYPKPYGIFHLICCLLIIGITILISYKYRNCEDKTYRKIIFIFWVIFIVLELIKELMLSFSYNVETGEKSWGYGWWYFPYQFCSTPFYVLLLVAILPDSKIRESLMAFITTFMLFAGLSVLAYPDGVFNAIAFLNLHTMVHHGSQVILGVFTIVYNRNKIDIKYFLKSLPSFAVLAFIAILLNETIPVIFDTGTFNMWFISSKFQSSLPVFSEIWLKVPYIVFLLIYFISFAFASFLINLISSTIIKLTDNKNAKKVKE